MPDELDKIRDAIARLKGWRWDDYKRVSTLGDWKNDLTGAVQFSHPVPASLDWVSENWPKSIPYSYSRTPQGATVTYESTSTLPDGRVLRMSYHDDAEVEKLRRFDPQRERHMRLALLLAVLEAEGTR